MDIPFQVSQTENYHHNDLPPTMKIHPAISIAQLEPAPMTHDRYGRITESAETEAPSYEIERLLEKRVTRGRFRVPCQMEWYKLAD